MKNSTYRKILTMLCLLLVCVGLQAQDDSALWEIIGFEDNVNDVPNTVPIDGFLGVALAVGAYYGVKKLRKKDQ